MIIRVVYFFFFEWFGLGESEVLDFAIFGRRKRRLWVGASLEFRGGVAVFRYSFLFRSGSFAFVLGVLEDRRLCGSFRFIVSFGGVF